MTKGWIQKAVKHPGRFTAYAHRHHMSVAKAAQKYSHSKNAAVRREAVLAKTLRSLHKK